MSSPSQLSYSNIIANQNLQSKIFAKEQPSQNVDADHDAEQFQNDGTTSQFLADMKAKQQSKEIFHQDLAKDSVIAKLPYNICQEKKKQIDQFSQAYQFFVFPYFVGFLEQQFSIDQALLKYSLFTLLKKEITEQRNRLISVALRRPQSSAKIFAYTITPKQRQKSKQQLKELNKIREFSDAANAVLSIFSEQNQKDFEYFMDLLSEFELNDYAYLFHRQERLQYFIGEIINNWDFFQPVYQPYFERFLDIIKIKIQFMSESRIIYPALYRIQKRLQIKMGYKGSRNKLNIDDHLTDLLFQHYIQQLQTRSNRNGIYYVRDPKSDQRIPLSEFIATCKEYFNPLSGWKYIFFIIGQHLTDRETKNDPKHDSKREETMRVFVQNVPNTIFPTQTCMGCSQFFYANHNIYRPQVCKHVLVLPGLISQISNNSALIKDEICSLLNGQGGALLFDCIKTDNMVIPRGAVTIEREKEEINQKLTGYLDGIYPKPQLDQNIFISWVPLVEDPFEVKIIPNKRQLNFQEGVYVARIVVKPTHGHVAYFWTQNDKPIFSIRTKSIFPEGKKQISGRSIYKLMKNKFNDFDYEFKNLHPIDFKVMKTVCTMDHQCKIPEVGIKLHQKKKEQNATIQHPEQKFQYASVAIAKKSDHETIRKNLLRYNIECAILSPFETLKLKGAPQSSILYHNVRFDQLQSVISNNKDFEFGGRNLFVILITQYIRLTERNQRNIMPQGDFSSLTVWLHKQYPKQTLKMWKFITDNNDQEFYIQTGSKESSLYIYIVMTQFLERSSFKNPKGLQRMENREKQSRLKLVYPTRR